MDEDPKDYEVGYGRPPKETRFAKGTSGNPNGRPKGSKNFATILRDVGNESITVSENGNSFRTTRGEALNRKLWALSLNGNLAAMKLLYPCIRHAEALEGRDSVHTPDIEKDKAAVKRFIQRNTGIKIDESMSSDDSKDDDDGKSSK